MADSRLGGGKVAQIAFIVRDIEASVERWAALLRVPAPEPITTDPGLACNMTYRGMPSNAQAKLAFFNLENVQIELIQPLGGDSTWQAALDAHGESMHHIAFWTHNMAQETEHLDTLGVAQTQRGDMGGGGQYAYYDATALCGVEVELLEPGSG